MPDQRETGISWTDQTWNPIRGCSRVSEGCRNCYAERMAARFAGPGQPFEGLARMGDNGPRWTGSVRLVDEHLADPLRWRRPRRVFVNSVSDLFHEGLTNEQIGAIFGVMAAAPQHTFQILTKRPTRMLEWFRWAEKAMAGRYRRPAIIGHAAAYIVSTVGTNVDSDRLHLSANIYAGFNDWPLPNVWLGVSVENQAAADERVPLLLQTPAAVRFLSCEPLLGPVDLTSIVTYSYGTTSKETNVLSGRSMTFMADGGGISTNPRDRIDWVIAGGESGPGSRPVHPDWVRSLRDQCQAAGVPFHFKQWGEWAPAPWRFSWEADRQAGETELAFKARAEAAGATHTVAPHGHLHECGHRPWSIERVGESPAPHAAIRKVGKKSSGRLLDGQTWDEFPAGVTP
jgi:protein gp37